MIHASQFLRRALLADAIFSGISAVVIVRLLVQRIVAEQRGIPLPVLASSKSQEQYLAAVRVIENTVPTERDETAPAAQPAVLSAAAPNPAD